MNIFRSKPEKKAIAFVDQIGLLAKASVDPEEKSFALVGVLTNKDCCW